MVHKVVALLCLSGLFVTAMGQLKLPLHSDPKKPEKPFRQLRISSMPPLDTRLLSPQIVPHVLVPEVEMPENPATPLWNRIAGEPNSLPVGGMITGNRVSPGRYFPGLGEVGLSPADPTIAVGPNHIVETVNTSSPGAAIGFFTKSGSQTFGQAAQTFFSGLGATSFQFDPRVLYDRTAQRWVLIFDEEASTPQTSKILIAVSDDSDPNGVWYRYRVEAKLTSGGSTYWMDYPTLGYSNDAYVVAGNMFGFNGGFAGIEFIVLPKAPMLTGSPVTASYFRDPNTGSVQLADTFDAGISANVYGMCLLNSSMARIYAISNITTTPVLNFTSITVPSYTDPSTNAPSSPGLLDTLDGRLFSATWRGDHLVATHNIDRGGGVNAVRWYDVDLNQYPTGTPVVSQAGNILPPSGPHFHMGAASANGYGDIGAVFTRSAAAGPGRPADSMAAGRHASDPAGTMGAPVLLASSLGSGFGGSGTNRWGDYSRCVVDPVDDATFWGVEMIGDAAGGWITTINSWTITTPASLAANSLPATVQGTQSATGTVTLSGPAPQYGYVVSLTSTNPAVATVPASVTVPAGASSANYTVSTVAVASDTGVSIVANLFGVTRNATTTVLSPRLRGTVTLGDYPASPAGQSITIEVRNPGSTTVLDSYTTTLDASGGYAVTTSRVGTFDVAIKGVHWLRRVTANVTFNAAGALGVDAALTNGDVDGSNSVTIADFTALRAAFGSSAGDPNWNTNADLNGDGRVTLADFTIVRAHFGQNGDN